MTPDQMARWMEQERLLAVVQRHMDLRPERLEVLRYANAGDVYVCDYAPIRLQLVQSPMIPLSHKVN